MNHTLARLARTAVEPSPASDGQLLDTFLTGRDGAAFEALVRRHGPMVLAVCRRLLRHEQDAEDAFQAAFLVLARRAAAVRPRDAVGAWLYGVACRVALKARTARTRRQGRERPIDESVQPAAGDVSPQDLADEVGRLVRRLPDVYRAAVVACDLEGRSRKEAAEHLGWKEGTLSGRLARARDLLAARLRRAGLALPAGGVAAVLGGGPAADAVPPALAARVMAFAVMNPAAGASAPVAALTEGVVPTMILVKLKAAVAVAAVACAVGFGVWNVSGAGNQPGSSAGEEQPGRAKPATSPLLPGSDTGLSALQGRWRVVSITERDSVYTPDPGEPMEIEIDGHSLSMPFRDADAGWRRVMHRIVIDPAKTPKTIDLIAADKSIVRGIYEFDAGATGLQLVVSSGGRPTGFGAAEGGMRFRLARIVGEKLAPPAQVKELRDKVDQIRKQLDRMAAQKGRDPVELGVLREQLDLLESLLDRPEGGAATEAPPRPSAKTLDELKAARLRTEEAAAAQVQALAQAEVAQRDLEAAKARLAQADARYKEAVAQFQRATVLADEAARGAAQLRPPGTPFAVEIRDDRGAVLGVTPAQTGAIATSAEGLVRGSCGEVGTTGKNRPFATRDLWTRLEKAGCVRVRFAKPLAVRGGGNSQEVVIDEILVPVSKGREPDFILTRTGDTYRAFFDFPADDARDWQKLLGTIR